MCPFRFGTTSEARKSITTKLNYLSFSWFLLGGLFQIINRVSAQIVHLYNKTRYEN